LLVGIGDLLVVRLRLSFGGLQRRKRLFIDGLDRGVPLQTVIGDIHAVAEDIGRRDGIKVAVVRVAEGRLSDRDDEARRDPLVVVLRQILRLELDALGIRDHALPVANSEADLILGIEEAVGPLDLLELVLNLRLGLGQGARPLSERFDLGFDQDAVVDRIIDDIPHAEEGEGTRERGERKNRYGQGFHFWGRRGGQLPWGRLKKARSLRENPLTMQVTATSSQPCWPSAVN